MSDTLEDDFLDGCALDFVAAAEADEVAELRPLFPEGDATTLEQEWRDLFQAPAMRSVAPLSARAYSYGGSGYDLGLADRLRAQGLRVVEVEGWRTRGSVNFSPKGSVNHHTAGPLTGNTPSLNVCINGRSDVPGPLCNVYMARDNTVYVVAAGRANHAGKGGWRGLTGNSSVYGLEWENPGTSAQPVRQDQIDAMVLVHVAFLQGINLKNADTTCQHYEWTTRKIDAFGVNGNSFRQAITSKLNTPTPTKDWFDMATKEELKAVVEEVLKEKGLDALPGFGLQELAQSTKIVKSTPPGSSQNYMWLTDGIHARPVKSRAEAETWIRVLGLAQKHPDYPRVDHALMVAMAKS